MYVWDQWVYGKSLLSVEFCCKTKTILKIKSIKITTATYLKKIYISQDISTFWLLNLLVKSLTCFILMVNECMHNMDNILSVQENYMNDLSASWSCTIEYYFAEEILIIFIFVSSALPYYIFIYYLRSSELNE